MSLPEVSIRTSRRNTANRLNALKSTGPRTKAAKFRCALNLQSRRLVLEALERALRACGEDLRERPGRAVQSRESARRSKRCGRNEPGMSFRINRISHKVGQAFRRCGAPVYRRADCGGGRPHCRGLRHGTGVRGEHRKDVVETKLECRSESATWSTNFGRSTIGAVREPPHVHQKGAADNAVAGFVCDPDNGRFTAPYRRQGVRAALKPMSEVL